MPRVTSDDPDFLAGLNSVVAVQLDANRTGGVRSALGGVGPNYQTVSGFEAEPCRVVFKRASNVERDARPGAVSFGRVLFGASISLDVNNRLLWSDPDSGNTRYLYVEGSSRNAHNMSHHWVCDFTEYVA